MARRYSISAVVVLFAVAAGFAIAAPQTTVSDDQTPGQYLVEVHGDLAIKVDVTTGKTWILKQSYDESVAPCWFPIVQGDQDGLTAWHEQEQLRIRMVALRQQIMAMEMSDRVRFDRGRFDGLKSKLQTLVQKVEQSGG